MQTIFQDVEVSAKMLSQLQWVMSPETPQENDSSAERWVLMHSIWKLFEKMTPTQSFQVGKLFAQSLYFPARIQNFDAAVTHLHLHFRKMHRNRYAGYFQIHYIDIQKREIKIECCTPYPSYFNRGMLTALFKKYKQGNIEFFEVMPDPNHRPNQSNITQPDVYLIMWG
ncbi:MAG: hypothetical protein EAZ55_04070 [Cytophagales bacterium]|nr:MAG: hypothetical protein EAZ55_04070 [Cytophagales bacterium]